MLPPPLQLGSVPAGDPSGFTETLLEGALVLDQASVSLLPVPLLMIGSFIAVGGMVASFHALSTTTVSRFRKTALISAGVLSIASAGVMVVGSAMDNPVPAEEQAQVWVAEEHHVVVADEFQDELYEGEVVTGNVDGVEVTVRLVDTGMHVGRAPVFVLVDDVTGEMFGVAE